MTNTVGIYDYNSSFYTGTIDQPDAMTFFVKSDPGNEVITRTKFPRAALLGFIPIVSTFSGVARIVNATKVIFQELSQLKLKQNNEHSECWNGFKNLFRGLIEIVPLIGNISLILFDSVRASIYLCKVLESTKDSNHIAGIALDGKVIFQVDLNVIKKYEFLKKDTIKSDQTCLDALDIDFSSFLKELQAACAKHNKKIDLPTAFTIFSKKLNTLAKTDGVDET